MQTLFFYLRNELKYARKERKNPHYTFSLTACRDTMSSIIKKLELQDDYIWSDK